MVVGFGAEGYGSSTGERERILKLNYKSDQRAEKWGEGRGERKEGRWYGWARGRQFLGRTMKEWNLDLVEGNRICYIVFRNP
jgi:hypothetical protein